MAALIGGAIAASGALSAGSSLLGSSKASSASKEAANVQKQMYLQTRSDLMPYNETGQNALTQAYNLASLGGTGGGPDYVTLAQQYWPGNTLTQSELEKTPGYQFTLGQGLKAVQSAAAAKGLGVSGASLKGAAEYVKGLADSTYKTQYDVAQSNFSDILNLNTAQQSNLTNQFNRLNSLATLGENAGAQTGAQGTSAASTEGKYIAQAGTQSGSGTINATNSLSSAWVEPPRMAKRS